MNKACALRPGDTVVFVAPASPCDPERYDFAVSVFESRGYRVEIGECCDEPAEGIRWPDEVRARELQSAWFDDGVKAVVCVRGGYGCARLLDHLDLDKMATHPKIFAGYSDITTLHIALNNRGLVTFHSPMPATLKADDPAWVLKSLFDAFEGRTCRVLPDAVETVVPGVAEGRLTGGCLRLVCDSLGTPNEIDTEEGLLILEDVDEMPHRVDAMLTHLHNAGKLQRAAGFLVGEMTRTDEKRQGTIPSPTWKEIVRERLVVYGKPAIIGFPIGHRSGNATLPLGARARLDATTGRLECLESGARIC